MVGWQRLHLLVMGYKLLSGVGGWAALKAVYAVGDHLPKLKSCCVCIGSGHCHCIKASKWEQSRHTPTPPNTSNNQQEFFRSHLHMVWVESKRSLHRYTSPLCGPIRSVSLSKALNIWCLPGRPQLHSPNPLPGAMAGSGDSHSNELAGRLPKIFQSLFVSP